MRRLDTRFILRDAVLARIAIFLVALAGAASCDGTTEPDPYAGLYGEYELHLYNGYGLPAQAPPSSSQGLSWEQVTRGRLTLRGDRSYLWTEDRYPGEQEGMYEIMGDSVVLHDAPWHPRMVHIWNAPDVLTTRDERRPTSHRLSDSTVYVRVGAEPAARHRYRAYELIALDGEPLPLLDMDRGIFLNGGYVWLFDAGYYDRLTNDTYMWGYRGAYTASNESFVFEGWMGSAYYSPGDTAAGLLNGDTLQIGPLTYLLLTD